MTNSPRNAIDAGIQTVEHEGLLWKPRPGATVTFEAFADVRGRFREVHEHVSWNPWDSHLLEEAEKAYLAVRDQWTRAEPGFRTLTEAECQARMDQWDADFDSEQKRKQAARQERARHYDPEREQARLQLLEDESILRHAMQESAELDGGSPLPAMPKNRRADMLTNLQGKMARYQERVDRLKTQVGDPETVVDVRGWIPAERRQRAVIHFGLWREREVTELRKRTEQAQQELKTISGGSERSAVRSRSGLDEYKLKGLLAVTRPASEQMCSECFRPQSWDRWRTGGDGLFYTGPCAAWPGWAARIAKTREMILRFTASTPTPPAAAKPQPLAVIPSGLPIADVVARLTQLQAEFPDGQVKRGRANRWEIWPPDGTSA